MPSFIDYTLHSFKVSLAVQLEGRPTGEDVPSHTQLDREHVFVPPECESSVVNVEKF